MAVDIKTLRIGSHVEYDGKRMVVASVSNKLMNCENLILIEPSTLTLYKNVNSYDVEPISITPELLKELGFEEDKTDIAKRVGGYYIYFHQINNLRWRVSLEEENCTNYGNCIVRYLHEAEAFLALHGV